MPDAADSLLTKSKVTGPSAKARSTACLFPKRNGVVSELSEREISAPHAPDAVYDPTFAVTARTSSSQIQRPIRGLNWD